MKLLFYFSCFLEKGVRTLNFVPLFAQERHILVQKQEVAQNSKTEDKKSLFVHMSERQLSVDCLKAQWIVAKFCGGLISTTKSRLQSFATISC